MTDAATTIVSMRGVSKQYGDATAVRDLSLEIRRGEVLTLLGHSGSGKSTTLRMIAGLERPSRGEILLRGNVVASAPGGVFVPAERRGIGLVFQSYAVWPHMTVGENIGYPLRVKRVPRREIRDRVARTCELVGMGEFVDRPATQLSGGQQQRVALGRAIIHEPDLLLLDEPFSNLDTQLREELRHYMKALQRRLGMSVLYVTHDQVEAMDLSDRVAVMYDGSIEQLDEPRQIYEHSASYFIQRFVGKLVTLNGVVASSGDDSVEVRIGDGLALSVPHPPEPLAPGTAVRVCIRPEDVAVTARAPQARCQVVPATVVQTDYLGAYQDCRVTVAGETLVIPVPKSSAFAPGDEVGLVFDRGDIRVWPVAGS